MEETFYQKCLHVERVLKSIVETEGFFTFGKYGTQL